MAGLARFAIRFRYVIIACWLIAGALCLALLPALSTAVNTDNSSFLPASAPSEHALKLAAPFQPVNDTTGTTISHAGLPSGLSGYLTGQLPAPASYDVSTVSQSNLVEIVPVVIVLLALLLGVLLRSLVAPLYLVGTVLLSYLTRIREEAHHLPLRQAVANAAHHTGTTVTSAGLILAATFGAAGITGATSQIKQLGTAIALGVLLDTFLVRTLLVPAIVVLCRRYNWWPSTLARTEPVSAADRPGAASVQS